MEVLGTYDPLPKVPLASADTPEGVVPRKFKDIRLDTSRTKYWLGVGAQPSDSVWRLLSLVRIGMAERNSQLLTQLRSVLSSQSQEGL